MTWDTGRLTVRPFLPSDAPALFESLSDPRVMEYIEPPLTLEATERFLETCGLGPAPLVYAVEEKGGGVVGHLIFHPYEGTAWELGWVLRRDRWGRGYARELTRAAIEYARAQGISALILECVPEQAATRRIARAFGFSQTEGADGLLAFRLEL